MDIGAQERNGVIHDRGGSLSLQSRTLRLYGIDLLECGTSMVEVSADAEAKACQVVVPACAFNTIVVQSLQIARNIRGRPKLFACPDSMSVPPRRMTLLHELSSPSSDWTARQPHARGWLG
jgi:hypothetical protein